MKLEDFYVVAREPGAENPSLPTWTSHNENPTELALAAPLTVTRKEIAEVPGAFQLLNVFSKKECQAFIDTTEALGYLPDAPVSLARNIRHNDNVTWVVDETTDQLIWQRCGHLFEGQKAVGINARFRFYRYKEGDFFKFHTDGAWPGSRVIDQQLIGNAYPDRYSEMTFLIYLSEDFDGGATRFRVNRNDVDIRTPAGSVLCFPHGTHPLHRVHSSVPITRGTKYIIRSDVLFKQADMY
ncbi:MAG: 2OG-Fe(II) oxygenase [Oleispira sp.]|nr:2OG-Fe(II) oxygenase [Oleispira sp.]MBL4881988.1 2OG-Fe(II) oxygenase [Oleispira sp.]